MEPMEAVVGHRDRKAERMGVGRAGDGWVHADDQGPLPGGSGDAGTQVKLLQQSQAKVMWKKKVLGREKGLEL